MKLSLQELLLNEQNQNQNETESHSIKETNEKIIEDQNKSISHVSHLETEI